MPLLRVAPLHSAPVPSGEPRNMQGILLMLIGFFFFAACDVQAKFLTGSFHPAQIVFFRQLGLFLGVLVLLAVKGPQLLRSRLLLLQITRGLTAVASATCFVLAVTHVPLADATAVTFIAPFIVTVLGAILLREPVGPRRWAAVAVGFIGMLIVIRPGMGVFHPAILWIVLAATFFASRQVLSRTVSGVDSIMTTVTYTSLTSTFVVACILPFVWQTPQDLKTILVIAGLGITAGLGEVFVIRALDMAQSVVLAPMHYSIIIWSTFYGFVVFAELPDMWTFVGCGIIVASGLYTLHREHLTAKERKRTAQAKAEEEATLASEPL